MEIAGHKTRSMQRRYRIVNEKGPERSYQLTGMRSGAAKQLEHKHVDPEAQVIRLPIELSKNKKGLTIAGVS
jgi:hypothetical protein